MTEEPSSCPAWRITLLLTVLALEVCAQGDEQWDYRFAVAGVPGAQGMAYGMAFDSTNVIFLGGGFFQVGQTKAEAVAQIREGQVEALPGGPSSLAPSLTILDLALFDNQLYAAGAFTNVGAHPAGGLAAWNGAQWSVPWTGTGVVWALALDAQGLLAAGKFSLPGWTNPVALARWDGSNFMVLNSELPFHTGPITCRDAMDQVVAVNGNIYGTMQHHQGQVPYTWPGHVLVRCDASNHWSLVPGPDGNSTGLGDYLLARFGDKLVAAGRFTNAAMPALKNIAAYDGTNWLALGEGLPSGVLALAASERSVYAACSHNENAGSSTCQVLRWDGTNWAPMGEPFGPDAVYRIFVGPAETVYVTGLFATAGDQVVPGLARWSGERWEAVLTGEFLGFAGNLGVAQCFAWYQNRMAAGGWFAAAGNTVQSAVALWRAARWEALGGSNVTVPPANVRTLASVGSKLQVGGRFDQIGGAAATNVACWNGHSWVNLAEGVNGTVNALAWWRDGLVVGGQFDRAGGLAVTNIASWRDGQWFSLGNGCNSNVTALLVWQNAVYAAGSFTRAGTVAASRIARWDGTNWHPLGAGVGGVSNAQVRSLVEGADGLYVAGNFTLAGGQPITNVARWDGAAWSSVGTPPPGEGRALAAHGGEIFLGVLQTNVQGSRMGRIYRWDGTRWTPLGGTLRNPRTHATITAIFATEQEVFVGGLFTLAGDKPSVGVARWIRQPRITLAVEAEPLTTSLRLTATGDPGLRMALESSPDLVNWITIVTNAGGRAQWTLPLNPEDASQFYRTRLVP